MTSIRICDQEVLLRGLMRGNDRYVARAQSHRHSVLSPLEPSMAPPLAAVLMCSDCTTNSDELFDLEPGRLFVMQTAANLAGEGEAAGVLLARRDHGVRLVLVIGHAPCPIIDRCGSLSSAPAGAICAEVRRSLSDAAKLGAPSGQATDSLGRVHTARMAKVLSARLRGLDQVVVAGAFLDERTGRLDLLCRREGSE